jgi:hypothetical protein
MGRVTKVKDMTEQLHQEALFKWAGIAMHTMPALALMFHPANGGMRPYSQRIGKDGGIVRYSVEGQKLARMGVKKGVPDVMLPCPRIFDNAGRAGLAIELKKKGEEPNQDQKQYLEALMREGWVVGVMYDWIAARDLIISYLGAEATLGEAGKWLQ